MAFKIKRGGWTIEVDSADELHEAMSRLVSIDIRDQSQTTSKKGERIARPQNPNDRNLSQLWLSFGNTKKAELLQALKENPDGMTDEALRARIHIVNNNALAGVLGAISKNTLKAGLKPSHIMSKSEQIGNDGKRVYIYKLTKEMMEAMP